MLKTFLLVFGVLVVAGGIQGLLAGSKASIIAAGILGALIIIGAMLLADKPTVGLVLALVGALGVAGRFVPAYIKAPDKVSALWPAGAMAILGVVALVWVVKVLLGK